MAPDLPDDFHAFWREAAEEAQRFPLEFDRALGNAYDAPGFLVETYTFRGIDGEPKYGWIAVPEAWETGQRLPAFLWVPPYGRESKLPDAYGTRTGYVSASLNFFGYGPFHQEKYQVDRGYFGEGVLNPETWIFRTMLQNAMIALRVLQAQIEVDGDRLAAMGMSQGAGISIWLGAWSPLIRCVVADMPFLADIRNTLSHTVYRYPLKELADAMESVPLGRERVFHTLSFYDTSHHATACRVPTQVSLGWKDPACRPSTVQRVYEALPGEKRLVEYDWGHDWHPDMIETNREWLDRWLT